MNRFLYQFIPKKFAKQEHYKYKLKDYDNFFYYIPKSITYKEAVVLLIRTKYSINDEIAFKRQEYSKPDEYKIYYDFVENCKDQASQFIQEREHWEKVEEI